MTMTVLWTYSSRRGAPAGFCTVEAGLRTSWSPMPPGIRYSRDLLDRAVMHSRIHGTTEAALVFSVSKSAITRATRRFAQNGSVAYATYKRGMATKCNDDDLIVLQELIDHGRSRTLDDLRGGLLAETGLDVHRSTVHRMSADYLLHTYKKMHLRAREASPALQENFAAECWRGDLRASMVLSIDEVHSNAKNLNPHKGRSAKGTRCETVAAAWRAGNQMECPRMPDE